jgi:hypothetical protein
MQSRLLLEQAVVNQASSSRDVAVARARVALIRDLPINTALLSATAQRSLQQQQPTTPSQQQQQRVQAPVATTVTGPTGSTTP